MRHVRALLAAVMPLLSFGPVAHAECGGLDLNCAISAAFHRVGKDISDSAVASFRPLVTDVMEREAPALIAQFQNAIDHGVLSAEAAGGRLIAFAASVVRDAIAKNGKGLVDYAKSQAEKAEKDFIADLGRLMKETFAQAHCEALGVNALVGTQRTVIVKDLKELIPKMPFWGSKGPDCTKGITDTGNASLEDLELPSLYKIWRCVRLSYVDQKNPTTTAIFAAYEDMAFHGSGVACALRTEGNATLSDITEIWLSDEKSVAVWRRALIGY